MTNERWQYIKNLQPSPGYVLWNSSWQGTYRNPSKTARRKAIKTMGRRQFLKTFKHVKREVTL